VRFEVHAAMFGFPVLAFLLFWLVRPRHRAVLAIFALGFMFLPEAPGAEYKLPGLPIFTKFINVNVSTLLAAMILTTRRLVSFRPSWADLPMLVFCTVPMVTSIVNDLGPYDGFSGCVGQTLSWGLSYYLGRVFFSRAKELRELAIAVFLGGVVYVPLCLIEIRMSPQLHNWVYGFQPSSFEQVIRFGGWRPVCFMTHGLVVGLWMSMATLVGFWLYLSGSLRSIGRVSILWFLIPLAITTVLVKSMGALFLLAVGIGVGLAVRHFHQRWFLWAVAAVPVLYIGLRAPGLWSGEDIVAASELISEERGGSLRFRLQNEDMLAEKALRRPVFGWGGWGRSRVYDEEGRDLTITDGLWIITLGYYGLVGLAAFLGNFLAPVGVMVRQIPAKLWMQPAGGALAALATLIVLYMTDCIPNATYCPLYVLAMGGMAGLFVVWKPPARAWTRPSPPNGPA